MIKINEIFHSIQGESTWAGIPMVFVRTSNCKLRCVYCDTKYSYSEGQLMEVPSIISRINAYGCGAVCITGGEPLLQPEIYSLMSSLCDLNFQVSIETSGSRNISKVDPRVKIILDIKTLGSGEENSFLLENLSHAKPSTEYKFVICSDEDFEWSENFCRQHELFKKNIVLYSPSFGQVSGQWLAEKILKKNSIARLQLQLHKYIWLPESRGV